MLDYILENPLTVINAATAIVAAASVVTAGTETPDPGTKLGKLYKIIEILALVIGKAKR